MPVAMLRVYFIFLPIFFGLTNSEKVQIEKEAGIV